MFAMHSGNRAPGEGAIPRISSPDMNIIGTPANNDVVFGLRCLMFKAAVETAVERLEDNLGQVNWVKNNSALLQEVTNEALKCLKKGGGRFLKPIQNGRGNKQPEGYIHYEDEDAYKKMEWYITEMGKKRQKASLERMLEMDSSDDNDDDDDDDDESSITSKFSQDAKANEEEYNKPIQPTEGVDVQPTEGDVLLSLSDEQYKKTMFSKFDKMGPKETFTLVKQGAENEAVQQLFSQFKSKLKSGGKFLVSGSNYQSKHKKYRVVDDKEARKKIRTDLTRRNHSTWHNKGEAMQVNTKKGGNTVAKRGRPSKKLAKKRGSIIKNFCQKRPFLSKSSTRDASKAKSSIIGNRKASESDTDGLSDSSDDSSVESTGKALKKDIVEMPHVIKLFNGIKSNVKSSRGSEKVFYIHLKKYIAQQIKKDGVQRSDFDKIQDFMARMIPNVTMLNEATDEDEITVYEAAIDSFIKECKAELPLSFFIKLE